MKYICPSCYAEEETPFRAIHYCHQCDCAMSPEVPRGRPKSDSHRRSVSQEKRAAKAYRVRRQPGSGCVDGYEGDGRKKGERMVEVKETTKKSYALKLETLLKLEKEARTETPIFQIEFQGVHPFKRYEVLPAGTLENLIAELDELKKRLA